MLAASNTPWWMQWWSPQRSPPPPPPPPPSQHRAAAVPANGLWPLAGERRGACRVEGGNTGSFDEVWQIGELACQRKCAASSTCVAIGFVYAGSSSSSAAAS